MPPEPETVGVPSEVQVGGTRDRCRVRAPWQPCGANAGGNRRRVRSASEQDDIEAGVVARRLGGVFGDVDGHAACPLVVLLEHLHIDLWGPSVATCPSDAPASRDLAPVEAGEGELSGVDWLDRTIRAVGPYDGVQMHDATALELGHPAEGEPHRPIGCRLACDRARRRAVAGCRSSCDATARGVLRVLEHRALVVVAIEAKGSADRARRLARCDGGSTSTGRPCEQRARPSPA